MSILMQAFEVATQLVQAHGSVSQALGGIGSTPAESIFSMVRTRILVGVGRPLWRATKAVGRKISRRKDAAKAA